jgi:hypothetical protein
VIQIEHSAVIRRQPEEVFGFMTDIANLPRWQTGAVKSEMLSEPPLVTGSRFSETVRVGPWKLETQCVVTELKRSEVFAFEAMSRPIDYAGSFRLSDEAGKTRVSLHAVAQLKGVWRLLQPLLASDLRKESRVELENLRHVLEDSDNA